MSAPSSYDDDAVLVWKHVRDNAHTTLCEPNGALLYKYVCPGGFYKQNWDWDSFFAGIGLLQPPLNGGPYLLGSMMNFLHYTNPETGEVPGCLTPTGPSTTLAHAKPVIIQGAYLGAKAVGPEGVESLREFVPKMRALLSFWERERRDPATGLYRWWDTMESGADDLVYFYPPSKHTPSWNDKEHALSHSAPDVNIFLAREHRAFALLLAALYPTPSAEVAAEMAASHQASKDILSNMASKLWCEGEGGEGGYWGGLNTRTGALLPDRTYQMAWPLWEGAGSEAQRQAAFMSIMAPDMRGRYGIRSTSSSHPRFSLEDAIIPYSVSFFFFFFFHGQVTAYRPPLYTNTHCT